MMTSIKREDFCFLVVDDFSAMRRIIAALLRELGFRKVVEAEDGKAALQVIETAARSGQPVHFVLSDINMPVMNGFQLLETLRSRPASDPLHRVPVLLVTAEGRREDIVRAAKLGATGYVLKPFNKVTIGDKIQLALKNHSFLVT